MEHLAATSPTCADTSTQYAFEYLAHPASVVSIEWRRTSKYMPRYVVLPYRNVTGTDFNLYMQRECRQYASNELRGLYLSCMGRDCAAGGWPSQHEQF